MTWGKFQGINAFARIAFRPRQVSPGAAAHFTYTVCRSWLRAVRGAAAFPAFVASSRTQPEAAAVTAAHCPLGPQHGQENSVRSLGVMAAELGALVAETNHGSAQTILEQK